MNKRKLNLQNNKNKTKPVGALPEGDPLLKSNTQRGITLLALIITIIVLLILAMVSIRLIMNEGIIGRAEKGKTAYSEAEIKEKIQLAYSELQMAQYSENNLSDTEFLRQRLEAQGLIGATVQATNEGYKIIYNGKTYPVASNGTIGEVDLDWDTIIASAQKHPDQSSTNNEIGVDMFGNPVNMDLWELEFNTTNKTCETGKAAGSKKSAGYIGNIVDGKIIGEIPQFIKKDNETYTLTSLNSAFLNNTGLITAPKIPRVVTNLKLAFSGCTSLTTIGDIGNSVTSLTATFDGCTSLTTVGNIECSIEDISSLFKDKTLLKTVGNIGGSVTNMNETFGGCVSLTTVGKIRDSVTNLSGTFDNCTSLKIAPTIPNSVTKLNSAFSGCTSLTTVGNIGNSVTDMGWAFSGCTSLTTVGNISDSVTNMFEAFKGCTSLTTVGTIGKSVTQMAFTFEDCKSLTGNLVINADDCSSSYNCFSGAATNDGCNLVVSGTCPQLDDIIATKSENSHITKGN